MVTQQLAPRPEAAEVSIGALREDQLAEADRIFRLAFGTFLGLPDPMRFGGDSDFARTRWRADPGSVFAAQLEGKLVGSNFVVRWGSLGFFGPLTVRPDLWDRGIGHKLMDATTALFASWGVTHAGLFTFAHSPKHLAFYQKHGFWPRFLTEIMSKPVAPGKNSFSWQRFSQLPAERKADMLNQCREMTGLIYDGLDVGNEIRSVEAQKLGDTVLLGDSRLEGLAVCHLGAGSEAGSGRCYVKFAAVRPGAAAGKNFGRLLAACEALAAAAGAEKLVAGVNLARHRAYRAMLNLGFKTDFSGVAMERDNKPGYNRPGVYLIDDWR